MSNKILHPTIYWYGGHTIDYVDNGFTVDNNIRVYNDLEQTCSCSSCSRMLPLDSYHKDSKGDVLLGLKHVCKDCRRVKEKAVRANYRAKKYGVEGRLYPIDIEAVYTGYCYHCGVELKYNWQIDHLTPLSRKGKNTVDNIVCSCASCNQSKGNLTEQEFSNDNIYKALVKLFSKGYVNLNVRISISD